MKPHFGFIFFFFIIITTIPLYLSHPLDAIIIMMIMVVIFCPTSAEPLHMVPNLLALLAI
jgi:hypothetical protein